MIERNLQTPYGSSRIIVGESLLRQLGEFFPREKSLLVVDTAVSERVAELLPDWPVLSVLSGESAKSLAVVERLYQQLLLLGAERGTRLIAIGGGALLDLVGFVAATFLRGLECGLVPSTLLSQVDASIGGKNGINFGGFKNIVGTIRQPGLVLCDVSLLASLPDDEFLSGLAEVVKHGAIADNGIIDLLTTKRCEILARDSATLTTLINRSLAVKQRIVEQDPREVGIRRLLNFGHTVGHALEHLAPIKHGHAVSVGMCAAAYISVERGLLSRSEALRLAQLLSDLGLPTKLEANISDLVVGIGKDKKREEDFVHTVLLNSIGKAVIEKLAIGEWELALRRFSELPWGGK